MRHDNECDWSAADCGCALRESRRRRESIDARTAYRFIMLGGQTSPATYPYPVVMRPIQITFGERFALTEFGAFVLASLPGAMTPLDWMAAKAKGAGR